MSNQTPQLATLDAIECAGCHTHRVDVIARGAFCPKCANGNREPDADYIPVPRMIGKTRKATLITFAPKVVVH